MPFTVTQYYHTISPHPLFPERKYLLALSNCEMVIFFSGNFQVTIFCISLSHLRERILCCEEEFYFWAFPANQKVAGRYVYVSDLEVSRYCGRQ